MLEDNVTRVLIVDDDPVIQSLLSSILSDRYLCTTAGSAETALDHLSAEHFAVVISDIIMGRMSSIELLRRILDSSPDTVVMMISGDQEIDGPIEAIRSGAFDYIKKPFEIDQVLMAVDRAVAHGDLLQSKRHHEDRLEQLVAERTERLNYLAYYDPLTGLPNRGFFEETLARTLAEGSSGRGIAVMFVSLDRYKGLRDSLGNTLVKELLIEVSKRLGTLAGPEAIIARFEGDEFGLLLSNSTGEQATQFASNVLHGFSSPFLIGDYEMFVSASVGVSLHPLDGLTAESLLKHAAAALSFARKEGGNLIQFYTSTIHETAAKRLEMENDLRRAIEHGEFELFYQPKLEVNTRRICGVEALVRWNHPELGLLSPLDFIPIAEETGMIVTMGKWIIKTACVQGRLWHDMGHLLNVAVNLSACQFRQRDLVENIHEILRETRFDPNFLNLEVTESSIMNDRESAVTMLGRLRSTGITISIDDFGTGYSSLGYLKHLPIDVLKIDKSFIDDMTTDNDDAALVTAIISLARTLRLKVVAEGIETEEQLRFLHLLRCDEWQGYLFSKPVPAMAFEALLAGRTAPVSV